jgi:hypothetical protein
MSTVISGVTRQVTSLNLAKAEKNRSWLDGTAADGKKNRIDMALTMASNFL